MEVTELGLSQFLSSHPLTTEKINYKIKYLNVIEYFVRKYSKNNKLSKETISLYIKFFEVEDIYKYKDDVQLLLKSVTDIKFKPFKFFTYTYTLVLDIFFINSFFDVDKSKLIVREVKSLLNKRYHNKVDNLYNALYKSGEIVDLPMIEKQFESWEKNKQFFQKNIKTFLVTANMSAGKSMLLNAFIGKNINKTRNEACTSKVHYYFNKSSEDGFYYKLDGELNLHANKDDLKHNNEHNKSKNIYVGSYFRSEILNKSRLCLIDTPGVNYTLDKGHKELTKTMIESNNYDVLIYIINAENIGTSDDRNYLEYIFNNVKNDKIIFVVNKLDSFRQDEDSIKETVIQIRSELLEIGFKDPIVCPVSAYAGLLAKKVLYEDQIDDYLQDECKLMALKFNRDEFDLSKYYEGNNKLEWYNITGEKMPDSYEKYIQLLNRSGIPGLEKLMINI